MSAPKSVIELAEARQAARVNKDFALADSLRDQIFAAGFEVADVAGGFELTEKARFPVIAKLRDLKPFSLPANEMTVLLVIEGFIEDAITCINSIKANSNSNIAVTIGLDRIYTGDCIFDKAVNDQQRRHLMYGQVKRL